MSKEILPKSKHLLVVGDNSRMKKDFERYYEVWPDFPNFVDCCITSPPYRDEDGYDTLNIDNVAMTLNEYLTGPLWLNFGDLAGQMFRAPLTAMFFHDWGFEFKQTIIWAKHQGGKGQYTPHQSNYMFNNHHEYIYLMYPKQHQEFYLIDRYANGVPYTDKLNTTRWKHGRKVACPGSIWFIPYETIQNADQKLSSMRFPLALPTKCLLHTHLPKDAWVLDPWGGSGTVALAAKNLGYNSLTYEKDLSMVTVIQERVPEIEVIE